jgi:TrmH family RNA methyltransferase
MLTAHKIKVLQSLDKKKFRQKYNLFLVEGNKIITEISDSPYKITELFTTTPESFNGESVNIVTISDEQLKKISFLQHPKDSVALCERREFSIKEEEGIVLILDGIQDPGNLGTIIRLADWFGISQIICSEDTVDFYNPKVVQATMGSFLRVNIYYTNLSDYLKNTNRPSFGTDMEGQNIYNFKFPTSFNLILGNEGNGIRAEIKNLLTENMTIPRFEKSQSTESLNVAMSTGIILGHIFSKTLN